MSGFDAQAERLKHMNARRAAFASRMPRLAPVRIMPRDDEVRRFLTHPSGNAFPDSGAAEWPNDRFTQRRLADGSVTVAPAEHKPRHQQPREE
jgi:hypothetical protein